MEINIQQLIEGWKNHLFPPEHLKDAIKGISDSRLAICEECGYHSKYHKSIRPDAHCTNCECTLIAKTKCLSCECPVNKWGAVITPEEEETLPTDDE